MPIQRPTELHIPSSFTVGNFISAKEKDSKLANCLGSQYLFAATVNNINYSEYSSFIEWRNQYMNKIICNGVVSPPPEM